MSRSLSEAFKRAANSQSTSECLIVLLTATNDNFDAPIRLSSDPTAILPIAGVKGTVSRSDEYIYAPFNITLPSQDDTGVSRASVSIDNIDRRITQNIRQARSKIMITVEIVLASDPDTVEVAIENFQLVNVDYDAFVVSGELSVEYFGLEPYPWARFTPSLFPGAF